MEGVNQPWAHGQYTDPSGGLEYAAATYTNDDGSNAYSDAGFEYHQSMGGSSQYTNVAIGAHDQTTSPFFASQPGHPAAAQQHQRVFNSHITPQGAASYGEVANHDRNHSGHMSLGNPYGQQQAFSQEKPVYSAPPGQHAYPPQSMQPAHHMHNSAASYAAPNWPPSDQQADSFVASGQPIPYDDREPRQPMLAQQMQSHPHAATPNSSAQGETSPYPPQHAGHASHAGQHQPTYGFQDGQHVFQAQAFEHQAPVHAQPMLSQQHQQSQQSHTQQVLDQRQQPQRQTRANARQQNQQPPLGQHQQPPVAQHQQPPVAQQQKPPATQHQQLQHNQTAHTNAAFAPHAQPSPGHGVPAPQHQAYAAHPGPGSVFENYAIPTPKSPAQAVASAQVARTGPSPQPSAMNRDVSAVPQASQMAQSPKPSRPPMTVTPVPVPQYPQAAQLSQAHQPAPGAANTVTQAQVAAPVSVENAVDWSKPTWEPVEGCPALRISVTPVSQPTLPTEGVSSTNRRADMMARFSERRNKFFPARPTSLPCELLRDFRVSYDKLDRVSIDERGKKRIRQDMQRMYADYERLTGQRIAGGDDFAAAQDARLQIDKEAREVKAAEVPPNTAQSVHQEVVKVVWYDPEEKKQPDTRETIKEYANIFGDIWDDIKTIKKKKDNLESTAKSAAEKSRLKSFQAELDQKRDLLYTAIEAAIKFGDASFLENLGSNPKLVVQLTNALKQLCLIAQDYNGPLAKSIFRLMAGFTTLDSSFLLNKMKLDTLKERYSEDFDEENRALLEQIFDNARQRDLTVRTSASADDAKKEPSGAAVKPKLSAAKEARPEPKTVPAKKETVTKPSIPDVKAAVDSKKSQAAKYALEPAKKRQLATGSPSKRPRDDDSDSRTSKKVAVEGTAGGPASAKISATSASSVVRTKSSLLPGRNRVVPPKAPAKKTETDSSSSQPSFLASLMSSIENKEERVKEEAKPQRQIETPEAKAKRLRKEARRSLRVTFKPDSELVQIRYLEHDETEDGGREGNQLRDVLDSRSEGQMFLEKQRKIQESGEEDDDENEEPTGKEVPLREWSPPTSIGFGSLPAERRDKNFVTRGGRKHERTAEQEAMETHEKTEIMTVYTHVDEIPPTSRSPPRQVSAEPSVAPRETNLNPTDPKTQELHFRSTEVQRFGRDAAQQRTVTRLGKSTPSAPAVKHAASSIVRAGVPSVDFSAPRMMTQEERNAEVLRLLHHPAVTGYRDPNPFNPAHPKTERRDVLDDPKMRMDICDFEDVAALYAGESWPPTQPPKHIRTNMERAKEWWEGHNKEMAERAAKENEARATQMAELLLHSQQQQALIASYYSGHQTQQPQTQQPQSSLDYAAILRQVSDIQAGHAPQQQQQQQQQQQAQYQPAQQATTQAPSADANLHSLLATLSQGQQGQNQVAAPAQAAAGGHGQDTNTAAWQMYYAQQQMQAYQAAAQGQGAQSSNAMDPNSQWTAMAAQYAQYYAQQGQGQEQSQAQSQSVSLDEQARQRERERAREQEREQEQERQRDKEREEKREKERARKREKQREKQLEKEREKERKRELERERERERNQENSGRRGRGGGGGGRKHVDKDKVVNRALIGTKACTFWAEGRCTKGDDCTFRHDPADLMAMDY